MDVDDEETEEEMLQRAIEMSMQDSSMDSSMYLQSDSSMLVDDNDDDDDGPPSGGSAGGPDTKRSKVSSEIDQSIADLRAGGRDAASLAALEKDVGVLVKLISNPLNKPDEPKFRLIKGTNKTIARVLVVPGAQALLSAVGFVEQAEDPAAAAPAKMQKLEMMDEAKLADAVEAIQKLLADVKGAVLVYAEAAKMTKGALPVSLAAASRTVAEGLLNALAGTETRVEVRLLDGLLFVWSAGGPVIRCLPRQDKLDAINTFHTVLHNVSLVECHVVIQVHGRLDGCWPPFVGQAQNSHATLSRRST